MSAVSQLGLDGTEVAHPVRTGHPLTARQRGLLIFIRSQDSVRPLEVGMIMHQGREVPCVMTLDFRRGRVSCCEYASSDGVDALKRLERRGLVERRARGQWAAKRPASEAWA